MKCPDCSSDIKKRSTGFYTCERCGLSMKAWEIEQANDRAKKEISELRDTQEDSREKKRKERRKYRNWYEGREGSDQ